MYVCLFVSETFANAGSAIATKQDHGKRDCNHQQHSNSESTSTANGAPVNTSRTKHTT